MRRAEREEMYKSLKKIVKVHVIININMYNKNYNIINRYIIDLRVGWGLIARPQLCLLSPVSILYQEVSAVSSPPSGTEAFSFIFSSLFSYVSPQQGQLFKKNISPCCVLVVFFWNVSTRWARCWGKLPSLSSQNLRWKSPLHSNRGLPPPGSEVPQDNPDRLGHAGLAGPVYTYNL